MTQPNDGPRMSRFRQVDFGRGSNQNAARLYNERLVLSLIRRKGALSKVEIARLTGLSAQTATVLVKQLETDGLLLKQEPQRGRVGQPSVPFTLNADGALAYGLKIGRRSADIVLLNFHGAILKRRHVTYAYPLPAALMQFALQSITEFAEGLPARQADCITGLGLGSPYELWNWEREVGAPEGALDIWRSYDLRAALAEALPFPVYLGNDATAACAAELAFGKLGAVRDFLYVFIGSFLGGGLVLNGALVPGPTGNAAAIGSMPVPDGHGGIMQLIRAASLYKLENKLIRSGKAAGWLWAAPDAWQEAGAELDEWISESAQSLAFAACATAAVVDVPAIVLDGAFPADVRQRLVNELETALRTFDWQGLSPLAVMPGTIGASAREIGAASLPFIAHFSPDRDILLHQPPNGQHR